VQTIAATTLGWKPGSRMFARYGIVDASDTLQAQLMQEQWERAQSNGVNPFVETKCNWQTCRLISMP